MSRESKTETGGIELQLTLPVPSDTLFARDAADDVLTFLARRAGEEYSVSELADRTDHSKSSVSRAADTLVESELLLEVTDGTSRLLSIDPERVSIPDDPVTRLPQPEFHRPVRTAVDRLWTELDGPIGIVVYGSVARGEADRLSDIDLWVLVEAERAENQRRANSIRVDLEDRRFQGDRYGFDIDVECVPSVPTYADSIERILSEGVVVKSVEKFYDVRNTLLRKDERS